MVSGRTARTVSSPWATGRDREKEREEKREAVLKAAARAFASKGYYRTSLDEIADSLGVTKPTLYYYAKNKEELLSAVSARAAEQILADVQMDRRAPAFFRLRAFLRNYAIVATSDFGRCLTLLIDGDLSAAAQAKVREKTGRVDHRVRSLLEEGIADGSIAECNVKLTAFLIAGAISAIGSWYDKNGEYDIGTIAEVYLDQLSAGLLPRPQ